MNDEMKEKFINRLYNFWKTTDDNEELLLKEITENVNDGIDGINVLLDWCRNDFEGAKDRYMVLHNLNEEEVEKLWKKTMETMSLCIEK